YNGVGIATGRPRAARAVGNACGANPLALLVPCHRVVASDGIGGYGGRIDVKIYLLDLERRFSLRAR
ncbi:MAG: MGMT family protein, partial [Acidobacteriota bacterium]